MSRDSVGKLACFGAAGSAFLSAAKAFEDFGNGGLGGGFSGGDQIIGAA